MSQLAPKSELPRGLETMLYNKVRKIPQLQQSIKDYERAPVNSDLRSYQCLSTEVQRTVNLAKMHRNYQERDERMREIAQGKTKAAPSAEEQSEKKPKKEKGAKPDKKSAAPASQAPAPQTTEPSKGKAGK